MNQLVSLIIDVGPKSEIFHVIIEPIPVQMTDNIPAPRNKRHRYHPVNVNTLLSLPIG